MIFQTSILLVSLLHAGACAWERVRLRADDVRAAFAMMGEAS